MQEDGFRIQKLIRFSLISIHLSLCTKMLSSPIESIKYGIRIMEKH